MNNKVLGGCDVPATASALLKAGSGLVLFCSFFSPESQMPKKHSDKTSGQIRGLQNREKGSFPSLFVSVYFFSF